MTVHCGNSIFPRHDDPTFNLVWVQYNVYRRPAIQAVLWIYITLGILGNVLVILWRYRARDRTSRIVSFLIVSVALSGMVYGVHLLLFEGTLLHCSISPDVFCKFVKLLDFSS